MTNGIRANQVTQCGLGLCNALWDVKNLMGSSSLVQKFNRNRICSYLFCVKDMFTKHIVSVQLGEAAI